MTTQDSSAFGELDELYQEVILDHYRNPRNPGEVPDPDVSARGFNPFCGDEIILSFKLASDGKVGDVGSAVQGCSISQASASILTEMMKGKALEEVVEIGRIFREMMLGKQLSDEETKKMGDFEALQGVRNFPIRIKCALLAWATLYDGIEEYRAHLDGS